MPTVIERIVKKETAEDMARGYPEPVAHYRALAWLPLLHNKRKAIPPELLLAAVAWDFEHLEQLVRLPMKIQFRTLAISSLLIASGLRRFSIHFARLPLEHMAHPLGDQLFVSVAQYRCGSRILAPMLAIALPMEDVLEKKKKNKGEKITALFHFAAGGPVEKKATAVFRSQFPKIKLRRIWIADDYADGRPLTVVED